MEKVLRPNRIREALGQIEDQQPPYFREYLRRFQEDPTSRVFAPLADAYRRLSRLDEAVSICLEGLEHHPDFHGGRIVLAKCYLAKNQLQEARTELERVVRAVPENLLGQRLLGDVYFGLKNTGAALHCYKMALVLAPQDVALAEKVRELENGAAVFLPTENTFQDFEQEIPPLWANEFPEVLTEPSALSNLSAPSDAALQPLSFDSESTVDDEAFKIEHVSQIFEQEKDTRKREITTETLGDLYFSQGQFDKALRIFEKLTPVTEVQKKIQLCRTRLGVDPGSLDRNRKIALLRAVVQKARDFT